ncbi:MAG: YIP1 family protein [Phycisphaerales bacterium]|nr:MAG: YIP1 family protein [Phycisphaerales bacterium]
MRCKSCDYRLWNIHSRQCPECGRAFRPSEYEFVPNAVRFCCPHCSTAYYGTGEKGHLQPQQFRCVQCESQIAMDDMVLLPTEGVDEESTGIAPAAWLERARLGTLRAWWSTVGRSMIAPAALIERVPALAGTAPAWGFLLLTVVLVPLLGVGPLFVVSAVFGGGPGALQMVLAALVSVGMGLGGTALFALLWAGAAHGLLRLSGPTPYPASRTVNAVLYTCGPMLIAAAPCLGFYLIPVGLVWWTTCAVLAVHAGQRTSGVRACLTVGAFPCLVALAAAAGLVAVFTIGFQAARSASASASAAAASFQVQTVLDSLIAYADAHLGDTPPHAAALLEDTSLTSTLLTVPGSATSDATIRVADASIVQLDAMSDRDRAETIRRAATSLPPDVLAHRLGDFVFTYHGIDLAGAPVGLWVVILAPDPDVNPSPPLNKVWVGSADGAVSQFRTARMTQNLKSQNALRKDAGLAPLPDPFTVTHARPATAGDNAP